MSCDECGTIDTQHNDDCLYILIERYGDLRHHAGALSGTRKAHYVGDVNRDAGGILERIHSALRNRDS